MGRLGFPLGGGNDGVGKDGWVGKNYKDDVTYLEHRP